MEQDGVDDLDLDLDDDPGPGPDDPEVQGPDPLVEAHPAAEVAEEAQDLQAVDVLTSHHHGGGGHHRGGGGGGGGGGGDYRQCHKKY